MNQLTSSKTLRTAIGRISGVRGCFVAQGLRLLPISVLVGILFLSPAAVQVVSQNSVPPKTVTNKEPNAQRIDPRTIRPKAPPVLKLSVDKTDSYVGEERKFSISTDGSVGDSPFTFTFDFRDGTKVEKPAGEAGVVHVYRTAGEFTVSVTPSRPPDPDFVEMPVVGNTVTVSVKPFTLEVNPANVKTGEQVTFQVKPVSTDPSIRYRFHFGDGSNDSEWASKSATTHKYLSDGTFKTWVEIGRDKEVDKIAASEVIPIVVSLAAVPGPTITQAPKTEPTSSSNSNIKSDWRSSIPWREILIGIALFVIGVLSLATSIFIVKRISKWLWPPRPVFRARPDSGSQQFDGARDVAVELQLRLNANTAGGRHQLSAATNLVKSIRRDHG